MDEEMIVVEQDLNSLPPEAIKRQEERTVLDLDLNSLPPDENSIQSNTPELSVQGNEVSQGQTTDVVEIHDNDNVQETSREIFAAASENSRRNRELDLQSTQDWLRHSEAGEVFLRPVPPDRSRVRSFVPPVHLRPIPPEHLRGMELTPSIANTTDTPGTSQIRPPSSAAPTFICAICKKQLVDETVTKCGHIFCKHCIEQSLAHQKKCPLCRTTIKRRDTFRIYFPSQS